MKPLTNPVDIRPDHLKLVPGHPFFSSLASRYPKQSQYGVLWFLSGFRVLA